MDLILISDSKLKVTLSAEDMRELELDCDDIDYDNTETRRAFWSILDEAKHRTGFDAAISRVFIQVYPSKSGGCELYVTKLGDCGSDARDFIDLKKADAAAVAFGSASTLIMCCRRLRSDGYSGASSCYLDGNSARERYLLLLSGRADADILSEYGETLEPDAIHIYVAEHCSALREHGAVELFARL